MNIQTAIKEGRNILNQKKIKTPELDSEILMSTAINKDRKYIILNSDKKLTKKNFDYFKNLIIERSNGKPIAYLTGKKSFWKYDFNIKQGVLIPRPDTEIIIEEALKFIKNKSKLKVLDIGVGSGCILLSILKEKKRFQRHRY